jgi:hypothetical protein
VSAGVVPAAAQALGDLEEPAKTLATRAQAALLDEHLEGALRSFLQLHALLCPAADRWVAARAAAAGLELGSDPGALPLSSAAGLLGLWRELPDLDCERESVSAALLRHAAAEQDGDGPYALALEAPVLAEQAAWLQARLRAEPSPRSQYFRRLARRARGGLGDRARIQVQRGTWTVLERLPAATGAAADFTTPLGSFQHGDRLTLQWQNPLPGQVAVLAAVGDEHDAELTVLLPQLDSESGPRRHHEIIEVVGELSHVAGASHALLILWVPELVPPRWVQEVLVRRALPPEARVWRYHYEVTRAAPPAS